MITDFASRMFGIALLVLGTVLAIRWAVRLAQGLLLPGLVSAIVVIVGYIALRVSRTR